MSDMVGLMDMDGTLFDYEGQMRLELSKIASPGEPDPFVSEQSLWALEEEFPYLKARMRLIKSVPDFWSKLPLLQLGVDVLQMARHLGFQIQILTKGPKSHPRAWMEKLQCIQHHFPNTPVNIVSDTKQLTYGRFLVDDYEDYVLAWLAHRPRGLVIMPAQNYNKDFTHPNVIRYDGTNGEEVLKALEAVKKRPSGSHWKDYL